MIFRSHLISMIFIALNISIILALIKYDDRKLLIRYAGKLFIMMICGTIVFSWIMHIL